MNESQNEQHAVGTANTFHVCEDTTDDEYEEMNIEDFFVEEDGAHTFDAVFGDVWTTNPRRGRGRIQCSMRRAMVTIDNKPVRTWLAEAGWSRSRSTRVFSNVKVRSEDGRETTLTEGLHRLGYVFEGNNWVNPTRAPGRSKKRAARPAEDKSRKDEFIQAAVNLLRRADKLMDSDNLYVIRLQYKSCLGVLGNMYPEFVVTPADC